MKYLVLGLLLLSVLGCTPGPGDCYEHVNKGIFIKINSILLYKDGKGIRYRYADTYTNKVDTIERDISSFNELYTSPISCELFEQKKAEIQENLLNLRIQHLDDEIKDLQRQSE